MTRSDPRPLHGPPGLVGRAAERDALASRLPGLLSGVSSLLILDGEAGVGKTRLLAGLREQAEGLGITPLPGAGNQLGRFTPYHAWRPVFSRIFQLEAAKESMPAKRAAAAAALPLLIRETGSMADRLPLLNPVLGLDFPETPVTERLDGDSRADHTQQLLIRVLAGQAARRPLLLIMEDAHWLDSASVQLLRLAVQHVSPLYAVLALRSRDAEHPADLRHLVDHPSAHGMTLKNLEREETSELLCQALKVNELPPEVSELVWERAKGHPFLSIELAFALRDAGFVAIDGRTCRLVPDAPDLRSLDLPSTVDGAVIRHVERMSPSEQLALQVASVIGRAFAARSLGRDFASEEPSMLAESLPPLEHLEQMNRLASETLEGAYVLEQSLCEETVYRQLRLSQRQALHRAMAEWHERAYFQDLSPYYPLLAHHWLRAEEYDRAVEYLERAGDHALQEGAYQEARTFFEEAIAVSGEVPPARRAHWERQLGRAHLGLNQLPASKAHFHRALDLLGTPVPSRRPMLLAGLAREILKRLLRRISPKTAPARLAPAERDALLQTVRIYKHLCEVYLFTHAQLSMAYASLHALNLAERLAAPPQLAWAYAQISMLAGALKAPRWAEAFERKACAVPLGEDDLSTRAVILLTLCAYPLTSGNWERLEAIASEALAISERLGDKRRITEALGILGNGLCYRGEIAKGGAMFERILAIAALDGDAQFISWGSSGVITMRFRQGDLDGAMRVLEEARPAFESTSDGILRIIYFGHQATGNLRRGDWAKAWKYAVSAYGMAASIPVTWQLEAYFGIIEVCVAFLEAEDDALPVPRKNVERLARKACRMTRMAGKMFPAARPQASYWHGRYLRLRGKTSQAERALRDSLKQAQDLAMPYEEGMARQTLAHWLPSGDATRREHLEAAEACFARIGAWGMRDAVSAERQRDGAFPQGS